MADAFDPAPLTAALVRRAVPPGWLDTGDEAGAPADAPPAPGWRADVRLFAITWAAGFVFFLVFLA